MSDAAALLHDFQSYLTALNRSEATIESYTGQTRRFFTWLNQRGKTDPLAATTQHLEAYQAGLTGVRAPRLQYPNELFWLHVPSP